MSFAVLKPFLTKTAFYAKLSGRFSGPKTKVTRLIASKFSTNILLTNRKLLSKFHVARTTVFFRFSKFTALPSSALQRWKPVGLRLFERPVKPVKTPIKLSFLAVKRHRSTNRNIHTYFIINKTFYKKTVLTNHTF